MRSRPGRVPPAGTFGSATTHDDEEVIFRTGARSKLAAAHHHIVGFVPTPQTRI
jgi:hypothetical protein